MSTLEFPQLTKKEVRTGVAKVRAELSESLLHVHNRGVVYLIKKNRTYMAALVPLRIYRQWHWDQREKWKKTKEEALAEGAFED